jgi:hypothetical protein
VVDQGGKVDDEEYYVEANRYDDKTTPSSKYYPSFNVGLYPDGACVNDGNEPVQYASYPDEYLFYTKEECCLVWFVDLEECLDASSPDSSGLVFYDIERLSE